MSYDGTPLYDLGDRLVVLDEFVCTVRAVFLRRCGVARGEWAYVIETDLGSTAVIEPKSITRRLPSKASKEESHEERDSSGDGRVRSGDARPVDCSDAASRVLLSEIGNYTQVWRTDGQPVHLDPDEEGQG